MRIMVSLEHPSLAHQYHYVMRTALERGDELLVLAARKDGVTELLDAFGIPYTVSTRTTAKTRCKRGLFSCASAPRTHAGRGDSTRIS